MEERNEKFEMKILEIDLDSRDTDVWMVPQKLWEKHLGGSGLAALYFYERGLYDVDPLGPDNALFFLNGLLTGTNVPCACKTSVCTKSPLTGIWGESTVGGYWGAQLKKASWHGVFLEGVADRPVYIVIDDENVEIRDAGDLWGLDVYETSEAIKKTHGQDFEVACIGPAGEKGVLIAGIMVGGEATRAAGRVGVGAVMGSKKVKAIAVRGTTKVPVADKSKLAAINKESVPKIMVGAKGLTDFGTAGGVETVEANGDLSIRNWSLGSWKEGAAKTNGQRIAETCFVSHYGCHACPIRCGKDVKVDFGPYAGGISHGPEYETCDGFGANLLNDDLKVLVAANDMCNRFGLDTISTSGVIGWAMEAYEHGLITKEDTGGIDLTWGNGEAILELVDQIGHAKGFGAFLGQGVRRCAAEKGGLAEEFAVETKGLEFAYHDPRAFTSMAVNYATANRGACHLEALSYFAEMGIPPLGLFGFDKETTRTGWENKAEICYITQNFMETFNDLGLCKFLTRGKEAAGPEVIAAWVEAVTGIPFTKEDLMKAGERNFNLKRLFNYKLGVTRKDDRLPPRLAAHDKKTGAAAGSIPYLSRMLVEYYGHRGWTQEGVPTKERIAALGLDDIEGQPGV